MLIKQPDDIKSSEITPERVYFSRRNFIRAGLLAGSVLATGALYRGFLAPFAEVNYQDPNVIAGGTASEAGESLTPYSDITGYNNYYEFTTDKYGVARRARNFVTRPWTVTVDGLVNKPKTYDLDELLRLTAQEERIYRLRCVEGWSMVIPWTGLPLSAVLKDVEPNGNAAYVAFQTIEAPKQMPGWNSSGLELPYVEGLRLDEAMHPLTLLASGIYAQPLPAQNGAPLRLVVPWKYGFKSIKSIVKITLIDRQPPTTWNIAAPREYGFYSNVNPNVAHPRWSQAKERRIGDFLRRDTLLFNGYADQVAQLYTDMNLRKNF